MTTYGNQSIGNQQGEVTINPTPQQNHDINPTLNQTEASNAITGGQSFDHDQSTVNSPTQEHFNEKHYQQQGQEGAVVGTTRPTKWYNRYSTNKYVTWPIRAMQAIFAIITLALACNSLDNFIRSEQRMRYTVFCGSITLIYLFILFIFSFFAPQLLSAGAILIVEIILSIFWLASFIAVAALYSGFSCTRSSQSFYGGNLYGGYGYSWETSYIPANAPTTRISGCRSSKAAAAFAAFLFLFFLISSILIWYNVIRRMRQKNSSAATLFQMNQNGNKGYLDKTALAFQRGYDPVTGSADPESHPYESFNQSEVETNPNYTTGNTNTNTLGTQGVAAGTGYTGTGNYNTSPTGNITTGTYGQNSTGGNNVNIQRPADTYQNSNMV